MSKVQLSDICNIKYGKDHKSLNDGSIPVYGSGGIMRYVDSILYDEESVLIPRKGTLGNLFYLDEPFWTIDTLFYTEIDKSKVIPKYLYYNLKTINLAEMNVGTAVPSLTTALLNEIDLDLPSLENQEKIVNILSSFDDKIENNNAIIANIEEQAQTIFKFWFVDFEPFQDGGFIDSELGIIPKRWEVKELNEVFKINYGKNLPIKKLKKEGYPVFGSNGQIGYYSEYLHKNPKLLISCRGASSGKTVVSKPYSFITNNSLIMNEKKSVYFYYFKELFNKIDFTNYATGSAQPQITISNIKNIKIIIPSMKSLSKFNSILKPMFKQQQQLIKENQKLAETRDTLLPKLMSGEIQV